MSISNVAGVRADITEMLSKIREVSSKTNVFTENNSIIAPEHFDEVLALTKNAFAHVSQLQSQTEKVKNAYVSGDSSVSMAQVVVASEKSKLAFEGLVTVRNKILEAYKEIMNMPV
jgi:flagellar hook-basal body complex protein FliE